jgi:hypothetical protein
MHSLSLSASPEKTITGKTFVCQSSSATVLWRPLLVAEVRYSGLMCESCLQQLRRQAIKATQQARVLVLDYTRATFATDHLSLATREDGLTDAPAAIIVRPEQHAYAFVYALKMARLGIMRDVYLPFELEKVDRFVATMTRECALSEFALSRCTSRV